MANQRRTIGPQGWRWRPSDDGRTRRKVRRTASTASPNKVLPVGVGWVGATERLWPNSLTQRRESKERESTGLKKVYRECFVKVAYKSYISFFMNISKNYILFTKTNIHSIAKC